MKDLTLDKLYRLMTVTQFVTDLCINEVERRGELIVHGGAPCIPYCAAFMVATVLTRGG